MCGIVQTRLQSRGYPGKMLHEFLTANRELLITLCQAKVAKRVEPTEAPGTMDHGVPLFLHQLVETLRDEQNTQLRGNDAEPTPTSTPIGRAAALHGAEMLRRGFSIGQVVHDYGDVCQCVTALAVDQQVAISADEFRTLNRCLDNAIADAVAAFGSARQVSIDRQAESLQQRLAAFAAERRRLIDIARQSLTAIRTGNIGVGGATGALLAHALEELDSLDDRTMPEILRASPSSRELAS
jgi:hypothetical protein